jgi:hypothetical protein
MSIRTRLLELLQLLTRRKTPVSFVDWHRTRPVSSDFGHARGRSIIRYYTETFLRDHQERICGRVLEVAESRYTRQFGGDRVTEALTLHVDRTECPDATIVGDLTKPETLPADAVDCFICTETLNCIFDVPAAVAGAARLLKPGGVLLVTTSGIRQISRYDMDRWGDHWRMTTASMRDLLQPHFPGTFEIAAFGNVLAGVAVLQGLAVEDLPEPSLLDEHDPDYQVVVAAVGVKGGAPP